MENLLITQPHYIQNLFKAAWSDFKKYWKLLLLIQIAFAGTRFIVNAPFEIGIINFWTLLVFVIFSLSLVFLSLGFLKILLSIIDSKEPQVEDLWKDISLKQFFVALITSIFVVLIFIGGLTLFIIPGIILSVALMFYSFAIADQKKNIWESIVYSFELTKGYRWRLWLLPLSFIVPFVIAILGIAFIPVIGGYFSALVFVLLLLIIAFIYPLILARVYRELQLIYTQNEVKPKVKFEKVFSIVAAVIAPFALFAFISVMSVFFMQDELTEKRQELIQSSDISGYDISPEMLVQEFPQQGNE